MTLRLIIITITIMITIIITITIITIIITISENGGTCAQGLGVFECTCVEGYEGAACFFALALPTFLMPLSCALFFSLLCSSVSVCSTHHVVKITKF
jgi:hypothetical protein